MKSADLIRRFFENFAINLDMYFCRPCPFIWVFLPRMPPLPRTAAHYNKAMAKRMMVAVVGAGIGALAGLIIDYLGAGTPALWAGAAAGALIPQFVLGPPGH